MMEKPSLVLHIGLPKTGTTYLQRELFPAFPSIRFLARPRSDILRGTVGPEYGIMHRCFKQSAVLWRAYGDTIFGTLLDCSMENYRAEKTLLISDEGMSMAGKHFLLPGHLQELQQKATGWGFGKVKVICTIRRQDQWIGSQYAQMSNRVRGAGQADFERYVDRMLDYSSGYFGEGILLDYLTLREQLVAGVGCENVLMLPLELLTSEKAKFLGELAGFINHGETDHSELSMKSGEGSASKHNVRSSRPDAWELRPLRGRRLRLWPRGIIEALGLPSSIRLGLADFGRGRSVVITDAIRTKIISFFADRNRFVEKEIGFNLGSHGYY